MVSRFALNSYTHYSRDATYALAGSVHTPLRPTYKRGAVSDTYVDDVVVARAPIDEDIARNYGDGHVRGRVTKIERYVGGQLTVRDCPGAD